MTKRPGLVIAAATDGSCSGNPGPGGWGALIRFEDGSVEELGGHEPATTNNRMELQAALALLERLKDLPRHPNLTIRTDSKYLIDGLGKWLPGWKRKGWLTAAGKPVLNQDLWQALDHAQLKDVPLEYVKGHSGDPDNDRVDQIAVKFSKESFTGINTEKISSAERIKPRKENKDRTEFNKPAPPKLQRLLTRLELANQFAQRGYTLKLVELAQLVEEPISQLEKKAAAWEWRDWVIKPIGNNRWRLQPLEQIHTSSIESTDD